MINASSRAEEAIAAAIAGSAGSITRKPPAADKTISIIKLKTIFASTVTTFGVVPCPYTRPFLVSLVLVDLPRLVLPPNGSRPF